MLGAEVPPDWSASSLALVARSAHPAWGPGPRPCAPSRCTANANVVIGDVRFEPSLQAPDEIEIGYEIVSSFRRQGFATEAAGAVIDWLFREGGAAEIIAGCDRRNVASVRTLAAPRLLARRLGRARLLVGVDAGTLARNARPSLTRRALSSQCNIAAAPALERRHAGRA